MLLGAVAQAQNFAITATTEAAIRKNIVKGNAANYGFGMINDTLKLVGLTTRNVIFTGSTSKTDIGLGNVDNTSDLNKPVSTATQTALNLKQNQLNGTGFVKATGTTISYDNSTYLSTSTAASTYLPISNPTATGTLTAPTIANSLGANFATTSGNVGIGTTAPTQKFEVSGAGVVSSQITSTNSTAQLVTSGTVGQIFNTTGDLYLTNASTTNSTLFVNNGAERMRIFSNGRVGINTTTDAGYLLDVNGSARFSNSASTGGIEIGQTGLTAKIQYNSNGNLDITPRSGYNTIFTAGNVGIGTTSPNASSILDITSTTKGVLFPRMTTTEISAIASPADGLTVYNTTLKAICFYDAGAAVWKRVSHSNM